MFQLNFASRVPIYEQLYLEVIKLTAAGAFKAGDRLPAVRTLATQLGVNPNTVAKAYRQLEAEGFITSIVGKGSYISDKLNEQSAQKLTSLEALKKAAANAVSKGVSEDEMIGVIKAAFKGGNELD